MPEEISKTPRIIITNPTLIGFANDMAGPKAAETPNGTSSAPNGGAPAPDAAETAAPNGGAPVETPAETDTIDEETPTESTRLINSSDAPAGSGATDDADDGGDADNVVTASSLSATPSILYYRLRIIGFTLIVLIVICFSSYILLSDLDTSVENAVQTNIDSISLIGFSDQGIDCHIVGSIDVDYDKIKYNPVQQYFLKFASSWLIGTITISPVGPIKIFIKPDDDNDTDGATKDTDYFEFVEVMSPDLAVDVKNHHTTPIDLITSSKLNSTNFLKYSKYFLNKVSKFGLNAKFHADFRTPIFNLNNYPFNFYTHVDMDKDIDPEYEIELVDVARVGDSLSYTSLVSVENKLPFTFTLDPLDWVLSLSNGDEDHQQFIELSDFRTGIIEIRPQEQINITVTGTISNLAAGDAPASIYRLVQHYLAGEVVEVYLNANNKLLNPLQALPSWIINILADMHLPLKLKHLPSPGSLLHPISFHNFSVQSFDASLSSDDIDFVVGTDFSIQVDLPPLLNSIDINVPSFASDFDLKYNDATFVKGLSKKPHEIDLHQDKESEKHTLSANVSINALELSVVDEETLHKLILRILDGDQGTPIDLSADIDRLDVELQMVPLLPEPTTFKELSLHKVPITFPSGLDGILSGLWKHVLDLSISNIQVAKTTATRLDLILQVELSVDVLFALKDLLVSSINYNIKYREKLIASVLVSDIDGLSNKMRITNIKVSIYHSAEDKNELQELLSRFISGAADGASNGSTPSLTLDIVDGEIVIDGNENLSSALSGIDFHNISLPSFTFKHEDEINVMSPFLIDATIYILKSEIEISIYNPVTNCHILAEIVEAVATYEGSELGYIGRQHMDVTPGVFVSQRIPFTTNSKLGSDILRRAINNQLAIEIKAIFNVKLKGQLFEELQLMFRGSGLKTNIKL